MATPQASFPRLCAPPELGLAEKEQKCSQREATIYRSPRLMNANSAACSQLHQHVRCHSSSSFCAGMCYRAGIQRLCKGTGFLSSLPLIHQPSLSPEFPISSSSPFFFFFHAKTLPESMLSSLLPPFMHRAPIIGTLPANHTPPPHHHHLSPRGTHLARASPMPEKQKHGEIRLPPQNGNTPFPHCMAARFQGRKGEGKGGHLLVITGKINGKKGPEESGRRWGGGELPARREAGTGNKSPGSTAAPSALLAPLRGQPPPGAPRPPFPGTGAGGGEPEGLEKRGLGREKGQKSPDGTLPQRATGGLGPWRCRRAGP